MKKHKSQQMEVQWAEPEPFALAIQSAQDGDRIAAKKKQSQADKQEAEKQQTALL